LVTYRARLPKAQEAPLLFAICAFPIFAWSIVQVLQQVPSWILRLNLWDLAGVIAYTQALALLESGMMFLFLLVLSLALPATVLRGRHMVFTAAATLALSSTAIAVHLAGEGLRALGWPGIVIGLLVTLAAGVGLFLLALRFQKLEKVLREAVQRIAILTYLYAAVGVLGLFLVAVRNL
jgi:hypothetical protein